MKIDIINILTLSVLPVASIIIWKIMDKIIAPIINANEKQVKENIIKMIEIGDEKFDTFMKNTPETKKELEEFMVSLLRDAANKIEEDKK